MIQKLRKLMTSTAVGMAMLVPGLAAPLVVAGVASADISGQVCTGSQAASQEGAARIRRQVGDVPGDPHARDLGPTLRISGQVLADERVVKTQLVGEDDRLAREIEPDRAALTLQHFEHLPGAASSIEHARQLNPRSASVLVNLAISCGAPV